MLIKREESGSDEIRGKVIFIIWEIRFETTSAQPPFAAQEQTPLHFQAVQRYIVYKFLQTCCQTLRQYLTPLISPRLRSRRGCIKNYKGKWVRGRKMSTTLGWLGISSDLCRWKCEQSLAEWMTCPCCWQPWYFWKGPTESHLRSDCLYHMLMIFVPVYSILSIICMLMVLPFNKLCLKDFPYLHADINELQGWLTINWKSNKCHYNILTI